MREEPHSKRARENILEYASREPIWYMFSNFLEYPIRGGHVGGHVVLHPNEAKLGDNVANTISKRMSKTAPS